MWWAAAVVLYCSGFLPIHVVKRYIIPPLWPLLCIGTVHFVAVLRDALNAAVGRTVLGPRIVAAVLAVSLVPMIGAVTVREALVGYSNNYRAAAAEVAAAAGSAPVAGTRWHETLYLAYHLGAPDLGQPAAATLDACEKELDRAGAQTFLVWPESPFWSSFDTAPSWVLAKRSRWKASDRKDRFGSTYADLRPRPGASAS